MTPETVNARIEKHEAVCAERYLNIKEDLNALKKLVQWALGSMASGLVATLAYLLVHFVVK